MYGMSIQFLNVLVIQGLLNVIVGQLVGDSLTFQVTYRDFLPSGCFKTSGSATLLATQLAAWNLSFPPNDRDSCKVLTDVAVWKSAILSGEISGHPDFEAQDQIVVATDCRSRGNAESGGLPFPVGFCTGTGSANVSIVKRTMRTLQSGLEIPQYCQDGAEDRCGLIENNAGRQTQTQKKFFDDWYVDVPVFNRRVGQKLTLKRSASNANIFSFDSDTDNDAPEFGTDASRNFFGPFDNRFAALTPTSFSSLRLFPAWPQSEPDLLTSSTSSSNANLRGRQFWFTTELHTTFEFRDDIDMTFTFSGDDDFWAYVNGQLVIDLGGNHGELAATVDLKATRNGFSVKDFLGLVHGGIYTLDIFHAERKLTGSNFKIDTSLVAACNVQQSSTVQFDFASAGSRDITKFITSNVALSPNSGSFRLATKDSFFQGSSIFTKNLQNLEQGFIVTFKVAVGTPTSAEGFAFVVQAESEQDLPLSSGSSLNFVGIKKSFAIVFDLCANRLTSQTCSSKEVRLHFPSDPNSPNDISTNTLRVHDNLFLNEFERGETLAVQIIYFGGKPDFLEVYLAGSLFLRQKNFDIAEVIGGTGAFIGFTASTSNIASDITISEFALSTVNEAAGDTLPLFESVVSTPELLPANGRTLSKGFSFQTRDSCRNFITTGGLEDLVTAVFIEEVVNGTFFNGSFVPNKEKGEVEDNLNGTYTVRLKTVFPGTYALFLTFGVGCNLTVSPIPASSDTLFTPTVSFQGSSETCFQSHLVSAVSVLPLDEVEDPYASGADNPDQGPPVLVIALAASAVLLLALVFGVFLLAYRRKWNREKKFILSGERYRLEQNSKFAQNEELSTAAKKVLDQQKEILELRNKMAIHDRAGEISDLEKENKALKETLKTSKMEQSVPQEFSTSRNPKVKKHAKTEFGM